MVQEDGVEGALEKLFTEGVYLTVEEFKGRRPVQRGNLTFEFPWAALRNSLASSHIWVQSSGSRSAGAPFPVDFNFVHDHAINTHLTLLAHGGTDWRHAHWGMPGGAAIVNLLEFCKGGTTPARWFSQADHHSRTLHPRYRWSARSLRVPRLGAAIPPPEFVALDDPLPIVRWMVQVLRSGATPHLWTYATSAVRVCEAAWTTTNDLSGARFTMGGEPSTRARRALVERAGGHPIPRYGATETDIIGYACMRPEVPDDMHLLHDRRVVIRTTNTTPTTGLPCSTLLFSSLLVTDPLILLNVSLGDQAVLVQRFCNCPMEQLGWNTHIHTVRSCEKLTAAGVNFLDADVIRVLEDVLPACFGGAPTDYQLVEKADGQGRIKLELRINPAIGPLNESALKETFLTELGRGVETDKVMALVWRDAGLIEVERCAPVTTRSGKILHLHR